MENKMTVREQIVGALQASVFPINSQDELLSSFPCGEDGTICLAVDELFIESHEVKKIKPEHFPIATPEQAAELLLKIYGL
jgi:hypothetical protein